MAGLQRMIKSGIRLYNYRSHGDGIISPINRVGAPFNLHRSFCSSSRGDDFLISPNVKWTDNPITFARFVALRAEGISVRESQVLAEIVQELPDSKFDRLLWDIRRVRLSEKLYIFGCVCAGVTICVTGALILASDPPVV